MSCVRSIHEHSEQCTILEQEGLSSADRQHFSTVYGVNRHALLDNLTYFDVASGALIPDIMHVCGVKFQTMDSNLHEHGTFLITADYVIGNPSIMLVLG